MPDDSQVTIADVLNSYEPLPPFTTRQQWARIVAGEEDYVVRVFGPDGTVAYDFQARDLYPVPGTD